MNTPESILKETFGYETFRPLQREVIENILAGQDALAVMPTGGGKSLCYQIPALLLPGLTVVVSPLIALMKDQVEQLKALGVPAVFLNSTLSASAYAQTMQKVRQGEVKLLYAAPETLLTPRLFGLLDSVSLSLLTIDEAHCISEWGHDFRPEYRQLKQVRQRYPKAACLALTATATPRVQRDILDALGLTKARTWVASFNRENLFIEVRPRREAQRQITRFLERFKDQSGIIYCFSRNQVDDLAAALARLGFSALPYHAGLSDEVRQRNQEAFIRDDTQIMVATIAFGMGINKPNVRFVIHHSLPKSLEGYYQEIGRAGRDGLPAHCLLLYHYGDVSKQRYFIDQKPEGERRIAMQHLDAIVRYAENQSTCRRKPLLAYFGENFAQEKCASCDNCRAEPPVLQDITLPAQKFLSCVYRVQQRFGISHVIDVLRGSGSQKILQHQHQNLSTYGIGRELSVEAWRDIARQLLQQGYLLQNGELFTLSLTEKALSALKKRSPIFGQLPRAEKEAPAPQEKTLEYNHALFALLRQKRKDLADAEGLPPYAVFPDRTLMEMAAFFPQSPQAFGTLFGVGQVKAQKYAPAFLELIIKYAREHHLKESPRQNVSQAAEISKRTRLLGETYNQGASLQSLMERYAISQETLLDHLTHYALAGFSLRPNPQLLTLSKASTEDQQAALAAFAELGADRLKPVLEKMNGKLFYDELRLLRVVFLSAAPV